MKTTHLQECPCHATHSLLSVNENHGQILVVNLHVAVTLLICFAQCMCDTLHNMLLRLHSLITPYVHSIVVRKPCACE